MKKFFLACFLALPLTALGQQKASAAWYFNWSHCGNISFGCSGCSFCFGCQSNPWPCDFCPPGFGGAGFGGQGFDASCYAGMGYGMPYNAYAGQPAAPAAPTATVQTQPNAYPTTGYLPVGYNYAPGYWYGR